MRRVNRIDDYVVCCAIGVLGWLRIGLWKDFLVIVQCIRSPLICRERCHDEIVEKIPITKVPSFLPEFENLGMQLQILWRAGAGCLEFCVLASPAARTIWR
jgi:hypothetical protein